MFEPTAQERRDAVAAGFDPTGMSGPEVRKELAQRRAAKAAKARTAYEVRRLREACKLVGLEVPEEITSRPDLRALLFARLPDFLRERGIKEDAILVIPDGVLPYQGRARVGKLYLHLGTFGNIGLRFDGQRGMSLYPAIEVGLNATVITSTAT
jgi:hypothetical protein